MTTIAKTKKELYTEYDETPPPPPEREPLPKVSDGTAVNCYYYRDRAASVDDVSAPGYFNFMRDCFRSGANKGVVHKVTCDLGEITEGLITVDLHVVAAPSAHSGHVVMAVGPVIRYKPVAKAKN